jgi:tyrosyl-tRNA synthetase
VRQGEAARLIKGGGVYLDERRISDPQEEVAPAPGMLLRVGKRKVARLV